jgi:hypothetical protein
MRTILACVSLAVGFFVLVSSVALAVRPQGAQLATAAFEVPAPMAPGLPTKIVLAGTSSAGTTMATKGQCIRFSCTVDCSYRVTTGSSTATVDDNQLPAATPERFCLLSSQDTVTFYSTAAGTAYVAIAAGAP